MIILPMVWEQDGNASRTKKKSYYGNMEAISKAYSQILDSGKNQRTMKN